jgi:hypothetical protein
MQYDKEEIITPFWAENKGFIGGRDALGLQNSSITVYGRLLPGMTNLTQRLRYYSIYCWLLKEYEIINTSTTVKDYKHQYNFIRRAELIIAYLMVNISPNDKSVIGSDYANKHIKELEINNHYEIAKGADKYPVTPNADLYWDYRSGALGQYYGGSLVNLKLIDTEEGFFIIKEEGLKLAGSFEESVKKTTREHFLKCIEKHQLNKEDIEAIKPFSLNAIPKENSEWQFLIKMFLNDDGPDYLNIKNEITQKRKETFKFYLTYLNSNKTNIKFEKLIYDQITESTIDDSAFFGWYYYYINEALHFSLETIFWSFLVNLDGKIDSYQNYINEIVALILDENKKNKKIDSKGILSEVIKSLNTNDFSAQLIELEGITKSRENWKTAIGKATELIIAIYNTTIIYQEKIKSFETINFIDKQRGNFTENVKKFISSNLRLTYEEFIKKIVVDLLNSHIYTAYRKMGDGESNLLKFIVEDGLISHIETVSPRHTTPRLHTLSNFLKDLNLVNKENSLTPLGINYLNKLNEA